MIDLITANIVSSFRRKIQMAKPRDNSFANFTIVNYKFIQYASTKELQGLESRAGLTVQKHAGSKTVSITIARWVRVNKRPTD